LGEPEPDDSPIGFQVASTASLDFAAVNQWPEHRRQSGRAMSTAKLDTTAEDDPAMTRDLRRTKQRIVANTQGPDVSLATSER
jgi:hypothetical protein